MPTHDLYLDESGSFGTPQGPGERNFASQIAGFLVAHDSFSEGDAEDLLQQAFAAEGEALPDEVHATNIIKGDKEWQRGVSWQEQKALYARLAARVLSALEARGLQPVRLVNRERVELRDRRDTQAVMTATLTASIAGRLAWMGTEQIDIVVYPARVKIRGEVVLSPDDYALMLNSELKLALARGELPPNRWRARVGEIRPTATTRCLQICDLLSHASHDNFRPLSSDAGGRAVRDSYRRLLGAFDFTLAVPVANEQVERCAAMGQIGVGLQLLGERALVGGATPQAIETRAVLLARLIERCAGMPEELVRDQLQQVVFWLRSIVVEKRLEDLAVNACRWALTSVYAPLRNASPDSNRYLWFGYAVEAWLLTALNHSGRLQEGVEVARAMCEKLPELSGQWYHVRTLLGGLLTLAVHETDCRRFASASQRAISVANLYEDLAQWFVASMPEIATVPVRSELRGKALGTALQAQLLSGLSDPGQFEEARRINEAAIAEFDAPEAKRRQLFYRVQIEAEALEFETARQFLAEAIGCPDVETHEVLADAIGSLDCVEQGFALLHWTRIGSLAARKGYPNEARAFIGAFSRSGLGDGVWCRGQIRAFPAQGILFHLSLLHAATGDAEGVRNTLRPLALMERERSAPATALLAATAFALAAADLTRSHPKQWKKLLVGWGDHALKDLLPRWQEDAKAIAGISEIYRTLAEVVASCESAEPTAEAVRERLIAVAGRVTI
jgi:hypothetical protein